MKYIFKFFIIAVIVLTICGLAACGKVSDPVPLEDSGYPHSYPRR